MIDVHVLTHSKTRNEWLDRCLNSMRDQPCVVHVIEGVERNISAGRVRGFSAGSQEYVSFVDSDDYVLPGAFDAVLAALKLGHEAVATGEIVVRDEEEVGRQVGHHLYAMRRDTLLPHLLKWDQPTERFKHCCHKLRNICSPHIIDEPLYVWRLHADQSYAQIWHWAQERPKWSLHQT